MMYQPAPQDMEDVFDCEFRDPSGTRCIGIVRLRIGLEGATIENQNGILGKFAFTRILSWSTTDDKCFTFTVKTEQKTKQDITVWGPPQLIQAISDSVDAKVARLMVLKKEGYDINQLKSPPNPAAGAPMMQPMMPKPQGQGSRPFRKLSKLFSPKSKQPNMPPQNGFFPPGMPPPGSPQAFQQQQQQYGNFMPQQQPGAMQFSPQMGSMPPPPPPPAMNTPPVQVPQAAAPIQQQQAPPPVPTPAPVPVAPPAVAPPQPEVTTTTTAARARPAPTPTPQSQSQQRAASRPDANQQGYSTEYNFSPDGEQERQELQKTLSHTREYAHRMKEALMQRDEQVIEANKKAEEACTREEATSNKVKALEDQLKVQLEKYEELRIDVESIKRGGKVGNGTGAIVPSTKMIGYSIEEEGAHGGEDSLYQTYKDEADALRKANSMLRQQNHQLRNKNGSEGVGRSKLLHKKSGRVLPSGDAEVTQLRNKVSDLEDENSRLLQKIGDQERQLQDYEATVAQSLTEDGGQMFLGGGYEVPYSRPSDPMMQLKSLMGEAYLVKMALKKQANPSNLYVVESLDNWIMASHKLKKVCTF